MPLADRLAQRSRSGHERRLATQGDVPESERWNHNIHYHQLLLDAVPADAGRVLDVGCGEGMLSRQFATRGNTVVGIDPDDPGIELARERTTASNVEYVLDDVMTHPFEPGSFDAIVSVATLHHLETGPALQRFADLLRPGGVLGVVGLAQIGAPSDLAFNAVGMVATRVLTRRHGRWEHSSPVVWPPPDTYRQVRRIAAEVLPGSAYRRHVLWRYSLVWTKPS